MSLDNLSLDNFIITDPNGEFTLDNEDLDLYLHQTAEEKSINYTDLINNLLEDEQYSPYILYLLIYKFDLNNLSKEKIWTKLMKDGYYQINNIYDMDSLNLSQDDYNQVMQAAVYKDNKDIVELMFVKYS